MPWRSIHYALPDTMLLVIQASSTRGCNASTVAHLPPFEPYVSVFQTRYGMPSQKFFNFTGRHNKRNRWQAKDLNYYLYYGTTYFFISMDVSLTLTFGRAWSHQSRKPSVGFTSRLEENTMHVTPKRSRICIITTTPDGTARL